MSNKENSGIVVVAVIIAAVLIFNGGKFSTIPNSCLASGTFTDLGNGQYQMTIDKMDTSCSAYTVCQNTLRSDGTCQGTFPVAIVSQTNNPNGEAVGSTWQLKYDANMPVITGGKFVVQSSTLVQNNGMKIDTTTIAPLTWDGSHYSTGIYINGPPVTGSIVFQDQNYAGATAPPVQPPVTPTEPPVVQPPIGACGCDPAKYVEGCCANPITITPPSTDTSGLTAIWLLIFAGIFGFVVYLWKR